ncbi:hypothetical protein SAMN05421804_10351 [Proteiniclasticum ruminis]|uniref:Uncharacterized protein n=1 Tax=Proteiniclasticum ruminis TaxID=398199 RepID=A0A1G8LDG6_9CLOT|nr:hypothetical protein SAMN05421804_10351 [Proteiniclasticum ruminis]
MVLSLGLIYGCSSLDQIKEGMSPGTSVSMEEPEKFQVYPLGNGMHRILITNRFEEKNIESPDALYFYNEQYESHFLIKEEKKSEAWGSLSLEEYLSLSKESVSSRLEQVEESWEEALSSKPNQKEYYIRGSLEGKSITYAVEVIETEEEYVEMILWSFTENIEENKEYYEDLLRSFEKVNVASENSKGEMDEPEL